MGCPGCCFFRQPAAFHDPGDLVERFYGRIEGPVREGLFQKRPEAIIRGGQKSGFTLYHGKNPHVSP